MFSGLAQPSFSVYSVICPEFFYGVRSIFDTTPMLLTILATRLRGWDSQYPILEDV